MSSESRTGWHCFGRGVGANRGFLVAQTAALWIDLTCRSPAEIIPPFSAPRKVGKLWLQRAALSVFSLCVFFTLFWVSSWQWEIASLFKLGSWPAAGIPYGEWMQCTSGPGGLHHVRRTTPRHPWAHYLRHPPLHGPCAPSLFSAWALKLNSPISHPLRSDSCSSRKGPSTAIHLVSRSKGAVYLALADLGLHFKPIPTCKSIKL